MRVGCKNMIGRAYFGGIEAAEEGRGGRLEEENLFYEWNNDSKVLGCLVEERTR